MRPILLLGFTALLAFHQSAMGCINVSGVSVDGKTIVDNLAPAYTRKALTSAGKSKAYWQERLAALEKKMATKKQPALRDRSDYGGVLAHLGQYKKARQVLEAAEKDEPGDYAVASNLGTVYELLGDNARALEWIKKGIKRNPEAHEGTEWVHVKILEAKLTMATDPNWLESHSVLGWDYGTEPRPVLPALLAAAARHPKSRVLEGVFNFDEEDAELFDVLGANRRAMDGARHQLRERLQFVQAPDPIVGSLLFDLANARTVTVVGAVDGLVEIYQMAQEYHAPHPELIAQRIAYISEVLTTAAKKKAETEVSPKR